MAERKRNFTKKEIGLNWYYRHRNQVNPARNFHRSLLNAIRIDPADRVRDHRRKPRIKMLSGKKLAETLEAMRNAHA